MQLNWPEVHAPEAAGEAEAIAEGAAEATAEGAKVAEDAAVVAEEATADGATVAKTPPAGVAAAVEDPAGGADETAEAVSEGDSELPELDPPELEPLHPVREPALSPVCLSTISGPGLGKRTSLPSTVWQLPPRLA